MNYVELEQSVKKHYNELDLQKHPEYKTSVESKELDWKLANQIGGIKNKKVLNLGCGYPIDEIKFGNEAETWIAVDFASIMINKCKIIQKAKQISSKVIFLLMDISELRFKDNQFDIILSFSTIDHLPDPTKRIEAHKEAYRVLKNRGYLIITFPNFLSPRFNGEKESFTLGYEYHYHPDELRKELEDVGFKFIDFDGCDEDARTSARAGFIMKKEI